MSAVLAAAYLPHSHMQAPKELQPGLASPCPMAASCAAPPHSHAPQLPLSCLQVLKELQPGLNISRCSEADFLHFVRLATYCTRYVRLREVRRRVCC